MFPKFLWVNSEVDYEFGEEAKSSTNWADCIALTSISADASGSVQTLLLNLTIFPSQQMLPEDTCMHRMHYQLLELNGGTHISVWTNVNSLCLGEVFGCWAPGKSLVV